MRRRDTLQLDLTPPETNMIFLRTCVLAALVVLAPSSLVAWGPIGHMTVAYVAYQKLAPSSKARVRDLLKLNPDYANWEKQIPAGTSADEHDRMIFMIAAVWADDIKGESRYSDDGTNGGNTPNGATSSQNLGYTDPLRHKYWHFVDTPFSPDQTPLPPVPVPNAQTQIVAFRAVLASTQPDDLKSYDLVWLLHLIGDVHQPLHAVNRFTKTAPTGDAGGNKVNLFGNAASNLHSYWDDLPGSECKFCSDKVQCANRAIVLGRTLRPETSKAAGNTDTSVWVRESFTDAQTKVYRDPIGAGDQPYTIVPGSPYDKEAYKLALKRVAVAGARLAQVLNEELK
ncbi:MAG TPA: S1/P1 nuclease [Candidatus Sulfotelmatobacter sp.]|nr:S1/P1 nuclease [Candidatus Sulfotelmatobacter sp.]